MPLCLHFYSLYLPSMAAVFVTPPLKVAIPPRLITVVTANSISLNSPHLFCLSCTHRGISANFPPHSSLHFASRFSPRFLKFVPLASQGETDTEEQFEEPENKVEMLLENVKWDDKGLAVAIAQNIDTGAILMQGFVNRDALATTISSRKATFYSRSRSSLWTKGETSKNFINVHDIFLDCDCDSIIYLGKPDGPTCHTGSETCYYTSVNDCLENKQADGTKLALTTLYSLESTIFRRKAELTEHQNGKPSWTKRLLQNDKLLCSKIREEADELCRTLEENEHRARIASEMGDVMYHAMVLLALKDVKIEDVLESLRHRFAQSGIEEKKSRGQQN